MHVLHSLAELDVERTVVVVGHGAERVTKKVAEQSPSNLNVSFVEQTVQRGTGDAVSVGLTAFGDDDLDDTSTVVVLPGDTPLLQSRTMARFVAAHERSGAAASVLTARIEDPTGYGRVIHAKDGSVSHIVEQRDASEAELTVDEINTSIYCFRRDLLGPSLRMLSPDNSQGEYYLTDVIAVLRSTGHRVVSMMAEDAGEAQGVNDRFQLAMAERELRARTNRRWLLAGVTMLDPRQTFIDVTVQLGRDVTLYPGTILQGRTVIGDGCDIGPDARLIDTVVGQGALVESTVARDADIGSGAHVGPFAVLEAGAMVPADARTGPFVTIRGDDAAL
jgi:bifunctional UDP-N-acetylglucosamine pyrophosphorylase / glucosamine-1-phosphate N-acetyltransferase